MCRDLSGYRLQCLKIYQVYFDGAYTQ
jgi:hypothetical protein